MNDPALTVVNSIGGTDAAGGISNSAQGPIKAWAGAVGSHLHI